MALFPWLAYLISLANLDVGELPHTINKITKELFSTIIDKLTHILQWYVARKSKKGRTFQINAYSNF